MTKRNLIIIGTIVLVLIFWRTLAAKNGIVEVETQTVERKTLIESLSASGEVMAEKYASMYLPTGGKIAAISVAEGQVVKKGQGLISLDKTLLDTAYQQARAQLRKYEATVDYVHDQVKNHDKDESFTQKETRTQAEVARDKAYRNLVKAQQNLAEAVLRSPFDGIVSQIVDIKPGINIIYTQSFIEVINPETIYFSVAADQTDVSKITLGQPADIVFDIDQDKSYSAEIIFVALTPKLDETSTVYKVKLKVAEAENLVSNIKVGMTGDANFTISEKANALFVEEKFVQQDKSGEYLLTGANKEKVNIETGIEGDGVVEVIGNVHEGQEIYDQP